MIDEEELRQEALRYFDEHAPTAAPPQQGTPVFSEEEYYRERIVAAAEAQERRRPHLVDMVCLWLNSLADRDARADDEELASGFDEASVQKIVVIVETIRDQVRSFPGGAGALEADNELGPITLLQRSSLRLAALIAADPDALPVETLEGLHYLAQDASDAVARAFVVRIPRRELVQQQRALAEALERAAAVEQMARIDPTDMGDTLSLAEVCAAIPDEQKLWDGLRRGAIRSFAETVDSQQQISTYRVGGEKVTWFGETRCTWSVELTPTFWVEGYRQGFIDVAESAVAYERTEDKSGYQGVRYETMRYDAQGVFFRYSEIAGLLGLNAAPKAPNLPRPAKAARIKEAEAWLAGEARSGVQRFTREPCLDEMQRAFGLGRSQARGVWDRADLPSAWTAGGRRRGT